MTNTHAPDRGERLFRAIIERLGADPSVSVGTGFGKTPGLRLDGKIFAMLAGGELVVKLPKERVDELVASGTGGRFDPRRDGRLMKEWATIPPRHGGQWERLAAEALAFARSSAGGREVRR